VSANKEKLFAYLLRLGDNAVILGQQLGDWIGKGPELEEEMAMANFALDYIGQARLFYSLAGEIEGQGRSEDDLAFLRDGMDFHNLLLVEQPNGDFAMTIARQFYFESFYKLQLDALAGSTESRLAEIAVKASKEIQYHLRHSRLWLMRLGDGTEESHRRMQFAIDELWRYTGEMFSADEIDLWAAESGIGPNPADLRDEWSAFLSEALTEATLTLPDQEWMASGGKQGQHSEHLGYLLADMQFLQRAYPGATW
jgi:ring-1,2-phenylacetyl-CoA epoxidase subunit PaaC